MPGHSNPSGNAFDGVIIPTTAPADSSFRTNYLPYDVFISHHGSDVKHTIAHDIYKILDATGLRVFLDEEHLKLGDFFPITLQEAMGSASMHIAILSENYASSPWCMDELAYMMKTDIKFIPIFYYVEPSTARWATEGRGLYADAFDQYEMKGRYTEKLESWKSALHKASFYTGEIIKNQRDEKQAAMNVVDRVLKGLKEDRLEVAKCPVGLAALVRDFENTLQSAGPTQIVGIYGSGGVGKTTLAKELYNSKQRAFGWSSFLFDVRDAAGRGRLHDVQKRLLKDLDLKGKYVDFDNVDQGKEILKSRLRSVPMLVVLDDVDHPDQVNALLPARESLGQGSLIIVTTRDLVVLTASGISTTYEMRGMNPAHAQQLFCWHAFRQPSPLLGLEELARKFVDVCHGLPLSLQVLGRHFSGESSKNYWQSELDKVSRIMPDDIKSRLRISYDALDREEQEMFLDVACFFIGQGIRTAIAVWNGLGWNGTLGWQRLLNKGLVELDEENKLIRMHDHLRDMGREIANQLSRYRLWSSQQEAISIGRMANAFGGNCYPRQEKIIINTNQGKRSFAPSSLGLKIYVGDGNFITEDCSKLSRELVWLRLDKFKGKKFPSWLSLQNLRVLEILDPSELEDLWDCDNAPLQLRQLVIQGARKLEKVEGIKCLRLLKRLKIDNCPELYRLPSLAELTSAKEIELENCSKLEKIESLKHLRSLEKLQICDCPKLDRLPSLAELISLKKFILISCDILENVEGLESLRSLKILNINNCPELVVLPSLAKLTILKEIKLKNCYKLERIEGLESVRSFETFMIKDCPKFRLCIVSRF